MKYVNEYRDAAIVQEYVDAITNLITQPWTLMEICGGQTHTIVKYGLDQLLPSNITLIHGPGCPVCVTDAALIDQALILAAQPDIIFCSYGDMLRVPGTSTDLLSIKAQGGDVRIVYSPLDALTIARKHPSRQVVFFSVGFETTAPATAMAVYQADQQQIENFSVLMAHVLVPPAMDTLLSSPDCLVQGFLAAGHVCTVTWYGAYYEIAEKYHIPIVVTGFEPIDILQGIYLCLQQLEKGQAIVENQYIRSVQSQGNIIAQQLMDKIFQVIPRIWRGLGTLDHSGLGLRPLYSHFDAQLRFAEKLCLLSVHLNLSVSDTVAKGRHEASSYAPFALYPLPSTSLPSSAPALQKDACISGLVLQGAKKPHECPAFGSHCRPEHPLGAPMVSSEGACAAYYRYRSTSA